MVLLAIAACFVASAAVADPWAQIISGEFGDTNNEGVGWIQSFDGAIYVGFDRASGSTGGVQMYRSSDFTNWSKVVGPGSGLVLTNTITEIIRVLTCGTNDFLFGTHDEAANPARVYHSTDGSNWTLITTVANGYAPAGNSSIGGLAVQRTNLFTATANASGSQIWISRLNGSGYRKILDFHAINTNVNFISYMYAASNGVLYASTGHLLSGAPAPPREGFLYQSTDDGATWVTNSGVGNAFGDTNNYHIACLTEFRGCLYASINNGTTGGQLWRTPDGTNWVQVLSNGIHDVRNAELHHLSVDQGFLWVATLPRSGFADEVWRSSDGTNFTQSCQPGFGDTNNSSRFPSIGGLDANELFGARNLTNGAQVWRLGAIDTTPTLQSTLATNTPQLSWPELALGFSLEETPSLASPTPWTDSTNAVVTTNFLNTARVTADSAARFYRLRRP